MENQKENADIFISQAAKKFLYGNKEQLNVDNFYNSVRNYYMAACSYIVKKYPYDNELLINASVTDIDKRPGASFSSLKYFTELFPCLLPVNADIDALHGEFLRYQVEQFLKELTSKKIDAAWHLISQWTDENGVKTFSMQASELVIFNSNADCERAYSTVRKTNIILANFVIQGIKCSDNTEHIHVSIWASVLQAEILQTYSERQNRQQLLS